MMNSSRFTSPDRVIFLVWMSKIRRCTTRDRDPSASEEMGNVCPCRHSTATARLRDTLQAATWDSEVCIDGGESNKTLVFTSGSGNSILRSIRPGRSRAGSRLSILLVAIRTCAQRGGAALSIRTGVHLHAPVRKTAAATTTTVAPSP